MRRPGVGDPAEEQHCVRRLVADTEEEGPVERQVEGPGRGRGIHRDRGRRRGFGALFVHTDVRIVVDEEGTEAAAATAVAMVESAPSRSFNLTFDRPFLFCIRDRPTDAVLFLGRVTDAGSAQPE